MLRPRLRAVPLIATALVCAIAGLGAASFALRTQPLPLDGEPEAVASEVLPYPTAPERTVALVNETISLADGQTRSYALSIGTHLIRVRSEPKGLLLQLPDSAHCTNPLAGPERTSFETRCTLSTRGFLTLSNPVGANEGPSELASIYVATVTE